MSPVVRLREFFVILSLVKVSTSIYCEATCELFGVDRKTIQLRQDECVDSGDKDDCSYLEGILLPLHNAVREEVASGGDGWPNSSNMRLIEWDTNLEKRAQENLLWYLATNCVLSPSGCSWTSQDGSYVENYAMVGRPGLAPTAYDAAATWMFLNASEPFDDVLRGKFYRVVRAATAKMGCGDAVFTEKGLSARFLLCLYSPGGGLEDENGDVYRIGETCSECPPGTACNETSNYPSLCAEDVRNIIDVAAPISDDAAKYSPPLVLLSALLCIVLHDYFK